MVNKGGYGGKPPADEDTDCSYYYEVDVSGEALFDGDVYIETTPPPKESRRCARHIRIEIMSRIHPDASHG